MLKGSPCPLTRRALQTVLRATGLALVLSTSAALAQTSGSATDPLDWTGAPEDAAIARKEADAALAEGRRECARQRDDRAACLKQVQEDHAAMLKRLSSNKTRR